MQTTGDTGKPFDSTIIPDSCWLGGLKIDVSYDESLYKNRKVVGEARYPSQSIIVNSIVLNVQ